MRSLGERSLRARISNGSQPCQGGCHESERRQHKSRYVAFYALRSDARLGTLDAEGRQHGLGERLDRLEVVRAFAEGQVHPLYSHGLVGLAHLERVLGQPAEEAFALRPLAPVRLEDRDRKSTRLNSSHMSI